jgi:hypothetical protein
VAVDTQRALRRRPVPPTRRGRSRGTIAFAVVIAALALGYFGLRAGAGAQLVSDPTALARVDTGPFGGTVSSVRVFTAGGRRVPIAVHGGRITPTAAVVAPGERLSVEVVVRRPSSVGWLLGKEQRQRLAFTAPAAHLASRRLTVRAGAPLRITFDKPVAAVAYGLKSASRRHALRSPRTTLAVRARGAAGTLLVASAARSWERDGAPEQLTWFPHTRLPALVASPPSGSRTSPTGPLRLSFSRPVGTPTPTLSPSVPGHWSKPDDYTFVFTPSGAGIPLGSHVRVTLPHDADLVQANSGAGHTTRTLDWAVPPGSTLRLQQLLAQEGYLPLDWRAAGTDVAHTRAAETESAVNAPRGRFGWRYGNEPSELRGLWREGQSNDVDRGAIMAFQSTHGLTVDGFAGPQVWAALISDALKRKLASGGYSYVYVHRDGAQQTLTLWHDGRTVITTPGNTGVPSAPTVLGTFPVFEHLPVTTMTGTNPGGSHYSDPGIKWVSYFNGGDAVHAFDRASFGTPQSVGCVELPLAAAAKVWPYMPIGTLVTIEH